METINNFLIGALISLSLLSGCSKSQIELAYEKSAPVREKILINKNPIISLSEITNKNISGICIIEYIADLNFIDEATGGIIKKQEIIVPPGDDHVNLAFWSLEKDKWQVIFKGEELSIDNESLDIKSNRFCFDKNRFSVRRDARFNSRMEIISLSKEN